MSGGHFDYAQHRIEDIASEIERLVENNHDTTPDEWGGTVGRKYPSKVIRKFKTAIRTLRRAQVMAQRVDWLLSNDDGEESFLRRWKKDLAGLKD